MSEKRRWTPLIYAALIALGVIIGVILKPSTSGNAIFSAGKSKLTEILSIIKESYVDEVNTDSLEEAGINNMLTSLDPHSVYIPASELSMANEQLDGNFEGIGVEFNIIKDTIMVVSAISGGPAYELGIMAGDRIIAADTVNVAGVGITNEKVFKLLRGPKGSVVQIKIYRPSVKQIIPYSITRNKIPIFSIDASFLLEPKTGYIKISRFAENTHEEFIKAYQQLDQQGIENLVIDLRGNPGGYLSTAKEITDELIDDKKLIVYTQGRTKPKAESFAERTGVFETGKLIVLIDEGSASASEILSGAVQDWDRGVIVGRRSFGKGLVQEPYELKDGSAMRLTVSRYYTPSGRCIQKSYKNGKDYNHDLIERYENGEMDNATKTAVFDSTPYQTKILNRTVYGGGGIYPDVFVAIDTTYYSNFLTNIVSNGVISRFAYQYLDRNRSSVNTTYQLKSFVDNFTLSDNDYLQFLSFAKAEDIDITNITETERSKPYILLQIKALMARQLYTDKGYYMVMQKNDKTIKAALNAIQNYNAILIK